MEFHNQIADWLNSDEPVALRILHQIPNFASTLKLFEACAEVQKKQRPCSTFLFALSSQHDQIAFSEILGSEVRTGKSHDMTPYKPIVLSHRDLYTTVMLHQPDLPRDLILVAEHDDQYGVEYTMSMMHICAHAGRQSKESGTYIRVAIVGLPEMTCSPMVELAGTLLQPTFKILLHPGPPRTKLRMHRVARRLRDLVAMAVEEKQRGAAATASTRTMSVNDGILVFTALGAEAEELGLDAADLDIFRVYHIGPLTPYQLVKEALMDSALKLVVASPEMRFLRSSMRGIGHVMWLDGCDQHRGMVRDGKCGQILLHQLPATAEQLSTTAEYVELAIDRQPERVQVVIPFGGLERPCYAVAGRDFMHLVFDLLDTWPGYTARELGAQLGIGPSEITYGQVLLSHMGAFVGGELGHAVRAWEPTYPQHPLPLRLALEWMKNDWAAAYFLSHVASSQPSLACTYAAAQLATLMSLGLEKAARVLPPPPPPKKTTDKSEAKTSPMGKDKQDEQDEQNEQNEQGSLDSDDVDLDREAVLAACVGPLASWAPQGVLWMLHGLWLHAMQQPPTHSREVQVANEPLIISREFCKTATTRYRRLEQDLALPRLREIHEAPAVSAADRLTLEMALLAVSLHRLAFFPPESGAYDVVSQRQIDLDPLSRLVDVPDSGSFAVYHRMRKTITENETSGDLVSVYNVEELTLVQNLTIRRWHEQPWLSSSPLHRAVPWMGHYWENKFGPLLEKGLEDIWRNAPPVANIAENMLQDEHDDDSDSDPGPESQQGDGSQPEARP